MGRCTRGLSRIEQRKLGVRILLICHRYLPHSNGGGESWTRAMVAGLLALGHQVAVLARDHRGTAKAFTWHRVEDNGSSVYWLHHQLSDARSYRETWNDRRLLEPLRQIFADFEPEIVHLAHPDGWGIVPLELAREQDLCTGATLHDYKWLCARGQMLHPSGERCERIDEERCVRCIHDQLDGGGLRERLAEHEQRQKAIQEREKREKAGASGSKRQQVEAARGSNRQ